MDSSAVNSYSFMAYGFAPLHKVKRMRRSLNGATAFALARSSLCLFPTVELNYIDPQTLQKKPFLTTCLSSPSSDGNPDETIEESTTSKKSSKEDGKTK
ncbi:UNVERIFIED_CONTAM: hypothetical protein Sradi_7263500 [Sesamum radiatum]|uniref:Uncharacterized protein n=1 Tax=Sesamum radiatum TaxID=300843 RepID=A0AAW2IJL9_SESRA